MRELLTLSPHIKLCAHTHPQRGRNLHCMVILADNHYNLYARTDRMLQDLHGQGQPRRQGSHEAGRRRRGAHPGEPRKVSSARQRDSCSKPHLVPEVVSELIATPGSDRQDLSLMLPVGS